MFIIGGLGYIIPAIFFWFFGSTKIQDWNEGRSSDKIDDVNVTNQKPIGAMSFELPVEHISHENHRTKF